MKRALILLTAFVLLAVPAAARDLATVHAAGLTVTFDTLEPAHGWQLRVSAPNGHVFAQEFAGTETPFFTAIDDLGGVLPDGSYTWELVALPAPRGRDHAGATLAGKSQTGGFLVDGGNVVAGQDQEPLTRDTVIVDDLIVDGSLCVGADCVNGESFGFDTIRLKENNLRIKFQDTSASASFPSRDWQITINDTNNGGLNKFSIDDIDGSKTPFTIEAGAPNNSLYVDDAGNIGVGTATPVVEVHVVDGDSPTLRLEQDGSSGFTPQTWDLAGNETNFFVRDVTHSSKLPFKIIPNAPTNSLYVAASGNVGIGTTTPDVPLSIERTDSTSILAELESNSVPSLRFFHTATTAGNGEWDLKVNNVGSFAIDDNGDGAELVITSDAQFRIAAQGTAPASCTGGALYVDNTPSITLCLCTASNTWSVVSGSGNCS